MVRCGHLNAGCGMDLGWGPGTIHTNPGPLWPFVSSSDVLWVACLVAWVMEVMIAGVQVKHRSGCHVGMFPFPLFCVFSLTYRDFL